MSNLYWHGKSGLGSGEKAITRDKKGGLLPEGFSDPRLAGWIKDGTVSEKPFVSFEESKQDELKLAKMRVVELEDANDELKLQVKQGGIGDQQVKKDLLIERSKVSTLTAELAEAKKNLVPAADLAALKTELAKYEAVKKELSEEKEKTLDSQIDIEYLTEMVNAMEPNWTAPKSDHALTEDQPGPKKSGSKKS